MPTITVASYKDRPARILFVLTGAVLLVSLNLWVLVWMRTPGLSGRLLVLTLILGWMFWKQWRLFSHLSYTFSDTGIIVHLPNKQYIISHDQIEQTIRLDRRGWRHGWGIRYIPRKHQVYFTTGNTHLLQIEMTDGKTIFISPKEYIETEGKQQK